MSDSNYDMDDASRKHNRPIKPHNLGHMHESFFCQMQLCSILCKNLVQEKTCTRNDDTRSENKKKTISLQQIFFKFCGPNEPDQICSICCLQTQLTDTVCLPNKLAIFQISSVNIFNIPTLKSPSGTVKSRTISKDA